MRQETIDYLKQMLENAIKLGRHELIRNLEKDIRRLETNNV